MKEKFRVTGMTCSACSSRVEKTVEKLEGTEKVMVNLLTGSMQVTFDENIITATEICAAVEKAGYGASVDGGSGSTGASGAKTALQKGAASTDALDETAKMKRRLIWSVALLIPLMVFSMGHMVTGNHVPERPLTSAIALTTCAALMS